MKFNIVKYWLEPGKLLAECFDGFSEGEIASKRFCSERAAFKYMNVVYNFNKWNQAAYKRGYGMVFLIRETR